jgi:predicted PurR-regulated permease PerM
MVVISARNWRIALWLVMLIGVGYLALKSLSALLPFAVGAVLAYAMAPLVDRLAAVVPVRSHRGDVYRRGLAVILLYVALASGAFLAGSAVAPVAVDQVSEFADTLPETVDAARQQANDWMERYRDRVPEDLQARVDSAVQDASDSAVSTVSSMTRRTIGVLTGTITIVIGFAVMPFWMFYAMRDRHFVRDNFLRAVPEAFRDDAINMLHIGDRLLGRYIRAQLILGIVVGTAVGISLTLLGVQLSLAFGVIAGVTELIPIIGPWIGAVPGLVFIAATDPDKIIWVALVYLMVQQVENLLLVPRIQGEALEMHPAMILLVLSVGGAVFGFLGLLVAVPLTALLRELFWYTDRRLRGELPEEALAASHVGRLADVEAQLSHRDQLRPEPLSTMLPNHMPRPVATEDADPPEAGDTDRDDSRDLGRADELEADDDPEDGGDDRDEPQAAAR